MATKRMADATYYILLLLIHLCGAQRQYKLAYSITEEQPALPVGNLLQESTIQNDFLFEETSQFIFSQLTASSDLSLTVNPGTGALSTSGPINRDTLCPQSTECTRDLDFAVSLPGQGVKAVIGVHVTIIDLNDITPSFPQNVHSLTIPEAAQIGRSWSLPVATDNDSPTFGITDYRLKQNSDVFELRVTNSDDVFDLSLALISDLDREVQGQYTVVVLAMDPQSAGEMTVIITIRDSNDNAPEFETNTYVAEIVENSPQSFSITTVRATDDDVDNNGQIRYSFDANTHDSYGHLFRIDEHRGEITVAGEVDYESETVYRLVVVATDLGVDSLSATARVTINVIDDNDSEPEVTINALGGGVDGASVIENAQIGAFVAQVLVSDADSGENGRVTCTLNDNVFRLEADPDEGEYTILTAAEVDRENVDVYNLAIRCQDHGERSLTTIKQLSVHINDVNDNEPKFSSDSYTVSVEENSGGGTLVTTVTADDADIGINAQLTYSLSINVQTRLYVTTSDNVGLIRTVGSFDREINEQIQFLIYATDAGNTQLNGSAVIILNILDVNDEKPVFSRPTYTFEHQEEQIPFLALGQIEATDRDSYPSNFVTYSLAPEFQTLFDINSQNGELKNREQLNREVQPFYDIVAIATDNGNPAQSTSVAIRIKLIDINDNEPVFIFPNDINNTAFISNQLEVGSTIGPVLAVDADIGHFGLVTYGLEQNQLPEFNFNSDTGLVTLAADISDVEYDEYSLYLSASDQGHPPYIVYQTLYIRVNKTLSPQSQRQVIEKPNETAVIAVACVAGTLITVLAAGIGFILCRRRQTQSRKQHALKNAFVTITHKQECVSQHCPHDISVTSQQLPEGADVFDKDEYLLQRSLSLQEKGIDNPGLVGPPILLLNASPMQDDVLDHERDTSSAEGSNADSGRGPSEEGESQSHITLQQMQPTVRRNSAPRLAKSAQFHDAHLGFESPARRLLYTCNTNNAPSGKRQLATPTNIQGSPRLSQSSSHPLRGSPNPSRSSPRPPMSAQSPPPIPPHEPFMTRSSGHLPALYPHRGERHSFHKHSDNRPVSPPVQRSSSYRTDAPVKYVDGSCSKDVYV